MTREEYGRSTMPSYRRIGDRPHFDMERFFEGCLPIEVMAPAVGPPATADEAAVC